MASKMKCVFSFPFFNIQLEGLEDDLVGLDGSFGQLCCAKSSSGVQGDGLLFKCTLATEAESVVETGDSPGVPLFPDEKERVVWHPDEGIFRISAGPVSAWVFPGKGEAIISRLHGETIQALPEWRSRRFFADMILAFLSTRPCFSLHAALLSLNGEGLLVTAPRGQGKTTFSLSLIEAGWSLHTDDYALVRPVQEKVSASGLRRVVHMAEDTIEYFPGVIKARLGFKNRSNRKEAVELASMGDEQAFLREVGINRIVFLKKGGSSRTTWRALDSRDALPLLLGQLLAFDMCGVIDQAIFTTLGEMVLGAGVFLVETGLDLVKERSAAGAFMEIMA